LVTHVSDTTSSGLPACDTASVHRCRTITSQEERNVRLARIVAVATVAVAATATGVAAVQVFGSAAEAAPPGAHASTQPAKVVPGSAHQHSSTTDGRVTASSATYNWAGYAASGSTYTSVSANWQQPAVLCSSNGIVSFWVGLDGWGGSTTVEQTGTGVDCRSGSPQYYAWWETYPSNSQQVYSGLTVAPGDKMSSSVSYANGNDSLTLTDNTQGWSKTTTVAAPSGASNTSAEIVAEAASVNNVISVLPNFTSAAFTATTINGNATPAAGAQAIDMDNSSNALIARTGPADATAGGFTVTYTGGSNVHAAFQSSGNSLYTYTSVGNVNQKDPMLAGTSPGIAAVSGGYEAAYQDNTGQLVFTGNAGTINTSLGMMSGTSPSITALSGGGFEAAFQVNTGMLWVYSPANGWTNLFLGMMSGTSPSITALPGGGFEVAFQANTGELWVYTSNGAAATLHLGMMSGTSPDITTLTNGSVELAFQANTGTLWTTNGAGNGAESGQAMASGTSPSIASSAGGGYGVAYQTAGGQLATVSSTSGAVTTSSLAMAAGTSPSITGTATGGYETAVQLSNGDFEVTGSAGQVDTQQTMLTGTSPAIAQ
jgi:hypothetical protein